MTINNLLLTCYCCIRSMGNSIEKAGAHKAPAFFAIIRDVIPHPRTSDPRREGVSGFVSTPL